MTPRRVRVAIHARDRLHGAEHTIHGTAEQVGSEHAGWTELSDWRRDNGEPVQFEYENDYRIEIEEQHAAGPELVEASHGDAEEFCSGDVGGRVGTLWRRADKPGAGW